ncbi:MAG: hypothetical protein HY553_09620, partial [Elusimicrobia bacterium]|nr:hypothetical protein [Elusimicrobiota bacterium]
MRTRLLAACAVACLLGTPPRGFCAQPVIPLGRAAAGARLPFTAVSPEAGTTLLGLLAVHERLHQGGLGGVATVHQALLHYKGLDLQDEFARRALGAIADGLPRGFWARAARVAAAQDPAAARDQATEDEFLRAYEAAVPAIADAVWAEVKRLRAMADRGEPVEALEDAAARLKPLSLFGSTVDDLIAEAKHTAQAARAGRLVDSTRRQGRALGLAADLPAGEAAPRQDRPQNGGTSAGPRFLKLLPAEASLAGPEAIAREIGRAFDARRVALVLLPKGADVDAVVRALPPSAGIFLRAGRLRLTAPADAAEAARAVLGLETQAVLDLTAAQSSRPGPALVDRVRPAAAGAAPSARLRLARVLQRVQAWAEAHRGAPRPGDRPASREVPGAAALALLAAALLGWLKVRRPAAARRTIPLVPVGQPHGCAGCSSSCGGSCGGASTPAAPPAAKPPPAAPAPVAAEAPAKTFAKPVEPGGRVEGLDGFGDPVLLPQGAPVRVAVEVGSTTAKTVVLDAQGNIVHGTYQKHHARVYEMAAALLEAVLERFKDQEVVNVGFSGSAGQKVAEKLGELLDGELEARYGAEGKKGRVTIRYTNEVISQTAPIWEKYGHLGKDIHILEIGGEDSKFIHIGSDGRLKRTALNGECAAGTGTFLEEQVPRLGFDSLMSMIEGAWTVVDTEAPKIAGRCTVFAKSDITHLLRHENMPKELVAWGVNHTVGLTFLMNLVGEIKRGMAGDGVIVFQGGTSKNRVLVEAFRRLLEKNGLDPARLIVPDFPEVRIAQGAATFAAQDLPAEARIDREALAAGLSRLKEFVANRRVTSALPALTLRDPGRLVKTWKPYPFKPGEVREVFLGLDVGSTTTKFVLVDAQTDAVLYKEYVRTEGQPFEVMEQGIHKIRDTVGPNIKILHVGVTGSGREAMGAMAGADVVVDEINAHATAAGRLHPDADTIFEIGGQDSKYMSVMRGMVQD